MCGVRTCVWVLLLLILHMVLAYVAVCHLNKALFGIQAYTAEVAAILFVQLAISFFAFKTTQTLLDGYLILCLYPISLVLVVVLEHFGID